MGEYAHRNRDGASIKIGTCEDMYYLRLEDREAVTPDKGSSFGLRWRLPFPDEDNILPGEYDDYNRGESMGHYQPQGELLECAISEPGIVQAKTPHGLLVNIKCYHGLKLPANSDDATFFWNGKGNFPELASIREDKGEYWPVVRCAECGHQWRGTWESVLPHISNATLRDRLNKYAQKG
ncbi:MAG: hypothetical protein ABIH23_11515 [bacterium]